MNKQKCCQSEVATLKFKYPTKVSNIAVGGVVSSYPTLKPRGITIGIF